MPVETRSGSHRPPEPMAYTSTPAAPQQRHFPPRRRHVKTYGKSKAHPSMKQETLTQMRFVDPTPDEVIDLVSSGDEEEGDDEGEYVEAVKKTRTMKAERTNRRRTMGDAGNEIEKLRDKKRRKTMGDMPSGPSSSFHTQTLTQFLSNSGEDEDDDWKIDEDDEEEAKKTEEEEEFGLIAETPRKKIKTLSSDALNSTANVGSGRPPGRSSNTATPRNRQMKTEIPSSTQSIATPMLLKYSPAKENSPLKARSTNIGAPTPILKNAHRTPRQEIPDSLSTSNGSPTTPTPKAPRSIETVKKIRFELPEDKENITPGRTKPKVKQVSFDRPPRGPLTEVPDSDEDLSDDADTTTEDETEDEDVAREENSTLAHGDVATAVVPTLPRDEQAETGYEVGVDTQAALLSSAEPSTPTPLPTVETSGSIVVDGHPRTDRPPENSEVATDQIHEEIKQPEIPDAAEETIPSSPRLPSVDLATTSPTQYTTQDANEGFTQGLESQRVPLEAIHATGPITDRSDIVISLYREHMARLIDRSKTHEFRGWLMPDTVHRVWIYITKPESVLKYMCLFGPAKTSGQIDDNGLGNTDFNQGKSSSMKYAYEILQIYELNNPIPLDKLRENGWPSAPRRYEYIPPAVVGQLTANLRCALFMEDPELHQGLVPSSPNVTESQEIERQIRSDISHATQIAISSTQDEIIPSSQTPPPRSTAKTSPLEHGQVFARPALPPFQHAKSSPLQQHQFHPSVAPPATSDQSHKDAGFVRPSQATTISQMSSSSPEKSAQLPAMMPSSQAISIPRSENSSPSSYRHRRQRDRSPLRSSQFPTKSQMLPESLINDEIRQPPPIVWDSADESD